MTGRHGLTPDQLREWVEASCTAQGVPVHVTEPSVVSQVGVLLGAPRRKPSGGRVAPTAANADRLGPGRVLGVS